MNILFVCTGNTCRSPMAEGYLKSLNRSDLKVRSCGFCLGGEPVSTNSALAMAELGIDIKNHISQGISKDDIDWANKIICMSPSHAEALSLVEKEKVSVLGDGIDDPFGLDITAYRKCRDQIISEINLLFAPFRVKPAEREHISQIAKLERLCFSTPWTEEMILASISHSTKFFIAEKDSEVLGYIGISCVADEGYIANIAVFPNYRKQGVATALLNHVISLGRSLELSFISLEVRESNLDAIALYEKLGFKAEGKRRDFYTQPKEAALIMTLRYEKV